MGATHSRLKPYLSMAKYRNNNFEKKIKKLMIWKKKYAKFGWRRLDDSFIKLDTKLSTFHSMVIHIRSIYAHKLKTGLKKIRIVNLKTT